MILTGDEATLRSYHAYRLVMAAVSILQFIDGGTSRFGKQLIPHTDTEDGLVAQSHRLTNILYSLITRIRIARSVRNKQSIVFHSCEIIIPRHANHLHATLQQTSDNIGFHTAIHQNHFLFVRSLIVTNHFFARNLIHIINAFVTGFGLIIGIVIKHNFPHHHPMFAKHLCQFAGINAGNAGHLLALQPVGKTFFCIPMAVLLTVVTYNNGFGMYAFTFH